MYSAIARNKRNTVLIVVVFLLVIGALGFLGGYLAGNVSIGFIVLVVALGYAVLQYFLAARQATAIAGGVEIDRASEPRLWRTVENLAIATGMPMPRVFVIPDPSPNAFATGRDPEHAVVAATTGLLELMDDQELQGVMAHELGHVRNYDIRVSTMVFGLVVAVGLIADVLLRISIFSGLSGGRNRNSDNGGSANPVLLIAGIVAVVVAPIAAAGVQAAVSRQREYLADATGAMTTRHPEGLARALEKLGAYGRPMQTQNSSMAHLWIADPMRPGVMDRLFSTHPPLPDRIARLRANADRF
ncbi:M48 family metallopeptidase [Curtobacterium flaccumfaciens]|uniref:M48 family metallopeptidase n=1 Tax=Curtobacterium flaccumfaciens TaxID=2035 RepID=UPI000FFF2EF2|nr:M48 family metallopeptidase [Curtobacterium flaccumfaciens]MCS0645035.1 M48 family metallopeptidase [Curtobacterium flaccumfaciens pv. flaccumfaciens]MCS6526677.1 M48 family metallopeptidase [Curtobacterium flaccumfaciens pv. flaccumfaciens]MCS6530434.1 M48 family metallopeptidase [Curtobacterium flaccumfaciens pv. flaccumfaciens]NUU12180.1 M48 family metallopeptidase [Curtobacterium flaccumfaciens]RXF83202.1 protease [Curtobacterium flaccumfaciens pv. flaccumfaciens]